MLVVLMMMIMGLVVARYRRLHSKRAERRVESIRIALSILLRSLIVDLLKDAHDSNHTAHTATRSRCPTHSGNE